MDGITGGNVSVANAYLADVSTDKNRSKNFGKMAISSNLGFIVGPALAGILGATIYKEVLPVLAARYYLSMALFVIGFTVKGIKASSNCAIQFPKKKILEKFFHMNAKNATRLSNPKKLRFKDVFKLKIFRFYLSCIFLFSLDLTFLYFISNSCSSWS